MGDVTWLVGRATRVSVRLEAVQHYAGVAGRHGKQVLLMYELHDGSAKVARAPGIRKGSGRNPALGTPL